MVFGDIVVDFLNLVLYVPYCVEQISDVQSCCIEVLRIVVMDARCFLCFVPYAVEIVVYTPDLFKSCDCRLHDSVRVLIDFWKRYCPNSDLFKDRSYRFISNFPDHLPRFPLLFP